MFSGYNLTLEKSFFKGKLISFDKYKNIGEKHLEDSLNEYKRYLTDFINNETINGSELQEAWFPEIDADVFISHSHKDKDLANALAGWLSETFGLKVFIDSNVWGYSDELLENINSKYSNKRKGSDGGYLYSHEGCNQASQHVNIMLSVALQKMIDKVECVILLNTDNSVNVFDENNNRMDSTYSPWIYSEIVCTQIVRKKPLLLYRDYNILSHVNESVSFAESYMQLTISYEISLKHLIKLEESDLKEWEDKYNKVDEYALDDLYNSTHPLELEKTKNLFTKHGTCEISCLKNFFEGKCENQTQYYDAEYNICMEICRGKRCPFAHDHRGVSDE